MLVLKQNSVNMNHEAQVNGVEELEDHFDFMNLGLKPIKSTAKHV